MILQKAMDKTYRQTLSPSPPPASLPKVTLEKPATAAKISKPALGGRDSGIKKGQAAAAASRSANNTKSVLKELTEARGIESERMLRKREMAHEIALENAKNKRLKYEAKTEAARLEQQFKLEELKTRLEIARLETQRAAPAPVSAVPGPSRAVATPTPFQFPLQPSAGASSSSFEYVSDVTYDDRSSMGRSSSPMMFSGNSSML